ncbi:MAG: YtxH domain-containing protein [Candidatus Peregrinibacteria bacterium]
MGKGHKVAKSIFKVLTGIIVGGAVGSILGLTLAPKKGKDSREYLRDQSMKMFLKGKTYVKDEKKLGFFKRFVLQLLVRKKKQ